MNTLTHGEREREEKKEDNNASAWLKQISPNPLSHQLCFTLYFTNKTWTAELSH